MSSKNEFLRQRPNLKNRSIIYDVLNWLIPVLLICAGIFISTQTYAQKVGYNPRYCGQPFYVTESGRPLYAPLDSILIIAGHPFDETINAVLFDAYLPAVIASILGLIIFIVMAIARSYGHKNDRLYGTARWGTEKDLEKAGLTCEQGIVLAQFQKANTSARITESGSLALQCKKNAPLVCHAGGINTLVIAPTGSGKGVGTVTPTCLNYPHSMIIFDPKGELYEMTSGFRSQFSHVLKFSPVSDFTCSYNVLDEVHLDDRLYTEVGLITTNFFDDKKSDSTASFFDENAQDLLNGVIMHLLSSQKYEDTSISGAYKLLSRASNEENEDGESKPGESLFKEMQESKHYDADGKENQTIHDWVSDCAGRMMKNNPKVLSDIFSTVFSKLRLFEDSRIRNATDHSDFLLNDFAECKHPITLYLTVPFGHIDRVAPVFRLIINFMLRKFSEGETSNNAVALKEHVILMLDEFSSLGKMEFLVKTMSIMRGYGINFYLVVQSINQLVELYSQNHPIFDHCHVIMTYAPGKVEDAKIFSEMIGKESVTHSSRSVSGSRYDVALKNLNDSEQEVARDLINPDELMKLPLDEALIIRQNTPPYIAKKVVYYQDERFKDKAYQVKKIQHPAKLFGVISLSKKIALEHDITVGSVMLIKAPWKETKILGFEPVSRENIAKELAELPSREYLAKKHAAKAAGTETPASAPAAAPAAAARSEAAPASTAGQTETSFDEVYDQYTWGEVFPADETEWIAPSQADFDSEAVKPYTPRSFSVDAFEEFGDTADSTEVSA